VYNVYKVMFSIGNLMAYDDSQLFFTILRLVFMLCCYDNHLKLYSPETTISIDQASSTVCPDKRAPSFKSLLIFEIINLVI